MVLDYIKQYFKNNGISKFHIKDEIIANPSEIICDVNEVVFIYEIAIDANITDVLIKSDTSLVKYTSNLFDSLHVLKNITEHKGLISLTDTVYVKFFRTKAITTKTTKQHASN